MKKILVLLLCLTVLIPFGVLAEDITNTTTTNYEEEFEADYDDDLYEDTMEYKTFPPSITETTTTTEVAEEEEDGDMVKKIIFVVFFGTLAGVLIFGGIYVFINVSAASKNY